MKKSPSQTDSLAALRRKAEEKLRAQIERLQKLSSQDVRDLVHELGTHQIELEMQNEELRRAQEELEASRSRYAELYDFAPVGYFTFDKDGLIQEVNLTGAQLLGIERGLLLHKPFVGLIAEQVDREIFSKHRAEILQKEDKQTCEVRLKKKDGTLFYAQLQSIAKENIDGKAGSIRTMIIDITEPKRMEENLERARDEAWQRAAEQTAIMGMAPIGIAIAHDSECRHISVNATNARMLGLRIKDNASLSAPEEERPGFKVRRDGRELLPEEMPMQIAAKGTPVNNMEYEVVHPDGSTIFLLVSALPLLDKKGEPRGAVGSFLDITERKEAEKALQKAYGELELRVKERSGALIRANEQLLQEIDERKNAEDLLRSSYAEIKQLKDRFHAENIYLKQVIDREYNFGEIIGRSDALQYVFFRIEQVAPQDTTVLLLGETGTGKGVVARAIYSRSSPARRAGPFVTVNCSALPANLIESELFGREKGAFTGSSERQIGRFELADNGTLFLDEIGEMPMELQTKLLRVIQDGEFERLGGPKTIKVNVRIIASTNRNLEEAIRNNTFREDLFYRLNVFPVTIPPLRLRKDDIPLLVDYFVAKFNKKIGKKIKTVSKDTLDMLREYHWPGNVRELESIIERAVITSQGSALQVLDRFETCRTTGEQEAQDAKGLAELERDQILQVLQKTGWRIEGKKGAAAILGLNPSTLRGRMRKDGIRRS